MCTVVHKGKRAIHNDGGISSSKHRFGALPCPVLSRPPQNQPTPPQPAPTGYGAFAAPPGPPPSQQQQPGSAFAPAITTGTNGYDHRAPGDNQVHGQQTFGGYQAPAGPPPKSNFPPQLPPLQHQQASDPFADPDPNRHGAFQPPSQPQGYHPQTVSFDDFDRQQQPLRHSRTFTIENEPTLAAPNRRCCYFGIQIRRRGE
jgi:hypothetical protein